LTPKISIVDANKMYNYLNQ